MCLHVHTAHVRMCLHVHTSRVTMCLHVHTACLSSTCHEQPSCKFELGTLVYSVDQGCSTPGSGLWAEDFRALDTQNGSSKVEVHCGILWGPEDFIYHAEKHSLKKAEAAQGRGLLQLWCENGAAGDQRYVLEN